MNIEHLRAFTKLAISNNYTKTAADLFISQPALTKQIKSLEHQLGIELFERTSRSVMLSSMGKEFLPYAQRILAEYDAAINHIADYHSKSVNQINLGTHMFFSHLGFSNLISSFHEIFPNVMVRAKESLSSSHSLVADLANRSLDAAIFTYISADFPSDRVAAFPLRKEEIVLIAPGNCPFSQHEKIDLKELESEPFIFPSNDFTWHHIMKSVFAEEEVIPNIIFESNFEQTIASLVASGMGYTMFSYSVARSLQRMYPTISILRMKQYHEKITALGVRPGYKRNKALCSFIDFACNWATDQMEFSIR